MLLKDVQFLHVELSSECNAWCPGCPRNDNGYTLKDFLTPQNLDISKLKEAMEKLPNLQTVQFCGRYGDPAMHPELRDIVEWSMPRVKQILIHTNGSIRSTKFWSELGTLLKDFDHRVWFGIDGLEGIHEIYRQGTDFNKIIRNATAFIEAGGQAVWQFIPYQHNEHQLNDCIKLAHKLDFAEFVMIEGVRGQTEAKHYRTGESFTLMPWSKNGQFNFKTFENPVLKRENCNHLVGSSLYITASGKYTLCCHFDPFKPLEYEPILFDTIEETETLDIEHEINTQARPLCIYACAGTKLERKVIPLSKLRK